MQIHIINANSSRLVVHEFDNKFIFKPKLKNQLWVRLPRLKEGSDNKKKTLVYRDQGLKIQKKNLFKKISWNVFILSRAFWHEICWMSTHIHFCLKANVVEFKMKTNGQPTLFSNASLAHENDNWPLTCQLEAKTLFLNFQKKTEGTRQNMEVSLRIWKKK